jgi:hypothetical protein
MVSTTTRFFLALSVRALSVREWRFCRGSGDEAVTCGVGTGEWLLNGAIHAPLTHLIVPLRLKLISQVWEEALDRLKV